MTDDLLRDDELEEPTDDVEMFPLLDLLRSRLREAREEQNATQEQRERWYDTKCSLDIFKSNLQDEREAHAATRAKLARAVEALRVVVAPPATPQWVSGPAYIAASEALRDLTGEGE